VSRWPALRQLRIGCVQYLNAQPLIYGYDCPIVLEHPSVLAREIASGALDVALVPIFEALGARDYLLVDGVAIASDGPVFSVFLAHQKPLPEIRTIALDPASLTSVHLLKVLLAEFHGLQPTFGRTEDFADPADAMLLIGNQAIDFRHEHALTHHFLDLGAEWKRCTGLPFVYALWLLRPDVEHAAAAAAELRQLAEQGLRSIEHVVERELFRDAAFRRRYLTEHIRFGLGAAEKEGMELFRRLLVSNNLQLNSAEPLQFI
jgi:predicted solute-binding protein